LRVPDLLGDRLRCARGGGVEDRPREQPRRIPRHRRRQARPAVMRQHYLQPLLAPRSVALVGASEREGSLGSIVLRTSRRRCRGSLTTPVRRASRAALVLTSGFGEAGAVGSVLPPRNSLLKGLGRSLARATSASSRNRGGRGHCEATASAGRYRRSRLRL